MSLVFQTVDVKFTDGLDTKTQSKLVIPSKWNQLENVTNSDNDTPIRRDGIQSMPPGNPGILAVGNGLATYNNQLLHIQGGTVSSVSMAGTGAVRQTPGMLGYVGVSKQEIRRSNGMQDSCDVATGGGFTCYVWRDLTAAAVQTGLRMSLLDESTGAQLQADVLLITGTAAFCPRVVYLEPSATEPGVFLIFYLDGINSLMCRTILTTTPTALGAQTALIASASLAGINFDACTFGNDGGLLDKTAAMVVYGWADGTDSVRTLQAGQTAGVPAILVGPTTLITEAQLPIANVTALTCARLSAVLAGAFSWGFGATTMAGIAGVTIDDTGAVVTAATQLEVTGPVVNLQCHITATALGAGFGVLSDNQSSWATANLTPLRFVITTATFGVTTAGVTINSATFAGAATDPAGPRGPWIAGKTFTSGLNWFLPVCVLENYQGLAATKVSNNQQSTLFVLDVNTTTGVGTVVAKALYGALGVATINNNRPAISTPCSTPAVASGFAMAATERTLLSFVGGFNLSPSGVVRLTWSPNFTVPPIRAQLGESTYLAGGSLVAYDGLSAFEAVFPLFPEGISLELVGGGGAMTAGVHQVVVIAEWVDNAGQRKQSAPSLAVSMTVAANDRIRVRVPSLLLGQMTGIRLVAYVTQAAGLTFNRVGTVAAGNSGTANDPTLAFTTLALIDAADTAYAGNELLYTQPNQAGTTLPNLAPGPINALAAHQNRLWYDKADAAGQFGYSQQYINNVGLQFNEQLGGAVDVSGGRIVGFSELDEKMIIFCERKPYVVYGQGPNAAGGFSNYSDPQEIPSDVGCVEARSILRMPHGVIFKSAKGWQLLGRDLSVRYIGDGAAAFDGNSVCSAVLMEDRQECRFGSASGTQLIYNYIRGDWSTTVYRVDSGAAIFSYPVSDAVFWTTQGNYVTVSTVNGLNEDVPGLSTDTPGGGNAAVIVTTMRTAWLRMGIVNGFQRVRRLFLTGTVASAALPTSTLTLVASFNDSYQTTPPAYTESIPFTAMFTGSTPGGLSIDIRHSMHFQKCKSVAFTFIDTPDVATPAFGVNFQALSLELGLKKGVQKLPAAQSV